MDPEFCSEIGNFGAEAVSGLRKPSPQLPGRRTEIAAAVIRKRGGHPKAVLFRHLTERDVRRPEHPLDPGHALPAEPFGDGDAELLPELPAEGGVGHAACTGQLPAGRRPRHPVLCRLHPLPETEGVEVGKVFRKGAEIALGQRRGCGATVGRRGIKPVLAKHIPHHQVVEDIQMGIFLLPVGQRLGPRTGQQAAAVPRPAVVAPGVDEEAEDPIVRTESRQHEECGLPVRLFGRHGVAEADLPHQPAHGRDVSRQRHQRVPAPGPRKIDLPRSRQNPFHPAVPLRSEGGLLQTCTQPPHTNIQQPPKDTTFFGSGIVPDCRSGSHGDKGPLRHCRLYGGINRSFLHMTPCG